jgi:hypothetical protein
MDVIEQLHDVPVLGVCLGHQALAHAAGAAVVRAPEPVHGRLSALRHAGHPLFEGCPSGPGGGLDVVRCVCCCGRANPRGSPALQRRGESQCRKQPQQPTPPPPSSPPSPPSNH